MEHPGLEEAGDKPLTFRLFAQLIQLLGYRLFLLACLVRVETNLADPLGIRTNLLDQRIEHPLRGGLSHPDALTERDKVFATERLVPPVHLEREVIIAVGQGADDVVDRRQSDLAIDDMDADVFAVQVAVADEGGERLQPEQSEAFHYGGRADFERFGDFAQADSVLVRGISAEQLAGVFLVKTQGGAAAIGRVLHSVEALDEHGELVVLGMER